MTIASAIVIAHTSADPARICSASVTASTNVERTEGRRATASVASRTQGIQAVPAK